MPMTDNEVQDGKRYTYKDKDYYVMRSDGVVTKDPDSGNWYPAVVYYSCGVPDVIPVEWYVRRLEDFQAKFRPAFSNDA